MWQMALQKKICSKKGAKGGEMSSGAPCTEVEGDGAASQNNRGVLVKRKKKKTQGKYQARFSTSIINFFHCIKCALDSFVRITEVLALVFQRNGMCRSRVQAERRTAALKAAELFFLSPFVLVHG